MDISGKLKQKLVYWQKTGIDGFGKPTFADPVELACRWENTIKKITVSERQISIDAVVFINQDIAVGDFVFLGTLADISSSEEPFPYLIENAREVLHFIKTPDIKAETFERKFYL